MKKLLTIILCIATVLTGCSFAEETSDLVFEEIIKDTDEELKFDFDRPIISEDIFALGPEIAETEEEVKDSPIEPDEEFDNPDGYAPSVKHNNDYFVQYEDAIIFRLAKLDDTDQYYMPYPDGVFEDEYNGHTNLYMYYPNTGKLLELTEENGFSGDNGFGKLIISNDMLYISKIKDVNDYSSGFNAARYQLSKLSKDGRAEEISCTEILGTDSIGKNVVVFNEDSREIKVYNDEGPESVYTEDVWTYVYYVGSDRNRIYYVDVEPLDDEYNCQMLVEANIKTGEKKKIGIVPYREYRADYDVVTQTQFLDGQLFFTIGFFNGEGADKFCRSVSYCHAAMGKTTSARDVTPPKSKFERFGEFLNPPKFRVETGKSGKYGVKLCDGIPGEAGVDDKGHIGYYNEKGELVPVASGFQAEYSEANPNAMVVSKASLIGDKIYVLQNRLKMTSPNVYKRTGTEAVMVDINTGEKTVIKTISV